MSWSDWISEDPDEFSLSLSEEGATLGVFASLRETAVPGSRDFGAVIENYRVRIAAGEGIDADGFSVLAHAAVQAGYDGATSTFAEIGQGVLNLQGSLFADRFDWFPARLAGLTEGLDYAVRPDRVSGDTDAYVQYEAAHTSFLGWRDWVAHVSYTDLGAESSDYLGGVSAEPPWDGTGFDLRLARVDLLADGITPPWYGYGAGVSIGSAHVPMDLNLGAYAGGAHAEDLLFPLSAVAAQDFSLLTQPSFLDTVALPNPTPASASMSARFALSLIEGTYLGPVVVYQRPRWRYWIPTERVAAVRLVQRDDGFGVAGHPRLVLGGAANGASSAQASSAPRIGGPNTYL